MTHDHPSTDIGKHKSELDTPCLTIDLDRLHFNLDKMQQHVGAAGQQLRPHAKTHKCSKLAQLQIERGAVGICVAKVSEAEALCRRGVRDILITGPLATPAKAARFVGCLETGALCSVVVDSAHGAQLLDRALAQANLRADVLVDLNVGQLRTGVRPEAAVELGRLVCKLPSLRLKGLQAYAGHVQHIVGHEARRQAAQLARDLARRTFDDCRAAGLLCEILTGSGTGTFDIDTAPNGYTELQPGSYALMDADYARIGGAAGNPRFDDFAPALTILTGVVSANQAGFVTVDAGLKSVYQDGPAPSIVGRGDGLRYAWFGDEYGKIILDDRDGSHDALPASGQTVEMVVSHCDPTVNLHDRFVVTRNDVVVDVWEIDLRGKSQ